MMPRRSRSAINTAKSDINYLRGQKIPVRDAEGNVVSMTTTIENGFKLTPDALEKAITPKTKWLLMNF